MALIIAHRGAHSKAPENSLEAFKEAVKLKSYGIELDIHMTKDKKIIVMHDKNTKRMTGYDSEIKDLTLKQIKELKLPDNGKIPTLQEAFDLIKDKSFYFIDLREYEALDELIKIIRKNDMEKKVILSSDDIQILKRCYKLNKKIRLQFLASSLIKKGISTEKIIAIANKYSAVLVSISGDVITKDMVDDIHKNNLQANSLIKEEDFKKVKSYGVDYVMSNYPDKLIII